ncbi:glycerol-3-phosphate dehydrogenase [Rhizobium sp. KVB221]|uniref:Glycerol-3-phosphate dehydrogenase n=1 Tax=Rhizobium setariae TaxID=2801340 RepID=A0A936YT14_9HYPH|nr:glycerol-3-phosphate dehydrogenase [Rhizobium setariae]
MTTHVIHDIFIAGGGINGCGIARDAVGRGYSVFLAEMNDLASGTSSGSTKLIHGGLRYLEHYEFRLVRESLMEREVLWSMAPHIIWPLRFVLPLHKDMRPGWLIRLGLFLYDHIGGRKALPATRTLDLKKDPAERPLKDRFARAFEYSDCWVNDARLVVLNARDAADRGAVIRTRTKVISARREDGAWSIQIEDGVTGRTETVRAKLFVNAAGPWVDKLLQGTAGSNVHNVRLVQGSHIVIRKKFAGPNAYFFQNNDGRIFFAIPYEEDFTLIGTTDQDYKGDPANVKITDAEIDYLCAGASEYFREPVTRADMVWNYSGVRPLYDDGATKAQEATRDYVLKSDGTADEPQLINVFGGKITTYRRLAESMLEKIEAALGVRGKAWTSGATLPGGDFDRNGFDGLLAQIRQQYPFLSDIQAKRLVRLYGTRAKTILSSARSAADLGTEFGAGLTVREVDYLMDEEWARQPQDVLWRRTKLGLKFDQQGVEALDAYMKSRVSNGLRQAAQ